MSDRYGDSTRSIKAAESASVPGQPVASPMVAASTYHLSPDESTALDTYGRSSNPTWRRLESALAALEDATHALTFGSGMAAITAVLRVLATPGKTLVVPADGYYQVRRFAAEGLVPLGVTVIEAAAAQMVTAAQQADVVMAESPVNPTLDVVDLLELSKTCRSRGAILIVDNTAATPFGQQPLSLGADLVVASATKGVTGHGDLVAGYVAGRLAELMDRVARERLLAGSILGPFEAWLALRSVGSAGLRFDRQCRNAAAVAARLRGHPAVRSVRYPGLPDDPAFEIASRQMRRFGSLVSIELADDVAVGAFTARSDLLVSATSFGGIHSSVDRRARWGDPVGPGFARLSMGIEDTDDLVADVERALSPT